MTTVFIAGSITIKQLDLKVQERIMNIVHQDFNVIVGDADGVDTSIQQFLMDVNYTRVTVSADSYSQKAMRMYPGKK